MVESHVAAALTRGMKSQLRGGNENEKALEMEKVRQVARRPIKAARVRRRIAIFKLLTPIARRVPISGSRSRTLAKERYARARNAPLIIIGERTEEKRARSKRAASRLFMMVALAFRARSPALLRASARTMAEEPSSII